MRKEEKNRVSAFVLPAIFREELRKELFIFLREKKDG
jgi:hypothetical protein